MSGEQTGEGAEEPKKTKPRKASGRVKATEKLNLARAEHFELKNEKEKGNLIDLPTVFTVWDRLLDDLKNKIIARDSAVSRKLENQKRSFDEIMDLMETTRNAVFKAIYVQETDTLKRFHHIKEDKASAEAKPVEAEPVEAEPVEAAPKKKRGRGAPRKFPKPTDDEPKAKPTKASKDKDGPEKDGKSGKRRRRSEGYR